MPPYLLFYIYNFILISKIPHYSLANIKQEGEEVTNIYLELTKIGMCHMPSFALSHFLRYSDIVGIINLLIEKEA